MYTSFVYIFVLPWNYYELIVSSTYTFLYPGRRFRWPDPEGTCRKETEKTLDPAGIHWKSPEHGSSILAGKFLDFFRCIPITFLCFPPGTDRKSPEIFRPEYCFHVRVYSCRNRPVFFDLSIAFMRTNKLVYVKKSIRRPVIYNWISYIMQSHHYF